MSGDAFDAYTLGKTLAFNRPDGSPQGVEQYLPDRQVIWSTGPANCAHGKWFARDATICFIYENEAEEKCWFVYPTDNGLRAELAGETPGTILFEAVEGTQSLLCNDPDMLS